MSMRFAQVAPLRKLPAQISHFTYAIPDRLADKISPGAVVSVQFRSRTIAGVVIKRLRASPHGAVKDIQAVSSIALTGKQLEIARWLAAYYRQSLATILKSFLPSPTTRQPSARENVRNYGGSPLIRLRTVRATLRQGYLFYSNYNSIASYLIEFIKREKKNGQVLIVVPEHRHMRLVQAAINGMRLAHETVFMPPKQSRGLFFKAWKRAAAAPIVVGTLRALFLPFGNLAQIMVLEAEHRLFQEAEQNPRYHLADMVFPIANAYGVRLLVTGFSPDIRLLYAVRERREPVKRLSPGRAKVTIVDLRSEDARAPRQPSGDAQPHPLISPQAQSLLDRNVRPLLFILNRFGAARLLTCDDCRFRTMCENCAKPLIVDDNERTLFCPSCFFSRPVYLTCPRCSGTRLRLRGIGIESLARTLKELAPKRAVAIHTSRTAASSTSIEHADIIVSTNSIFSLDMSFGAVVFVNADYDLHLPHYHSAESLRHFVLKAQQYSDQVIVQTRSPEHYVYSTINDVDAFYRAEIDWRKQFAYPPFSTLLAFTVRERTYGAYRDKLSRLKAYLAPATYQGPLETRTRGMYRAVLLVKTSETLQGFLDPSRTNAYNQFQVEVNPYALV